MDTWLDQQGAKAPIRSYELGCGGVMVWASNIGIQLVDTFRVAEGAITNSENCCQFVGKHLLQEVV